MRTCPVGRQGSFYELCCVCPPSVPGWDWSRVPECRLSPGFTALRARARHRNPAHGSHATRVHPYLSDLGKSHPDDSKSYTAGESNGKYSPHRTNGEGICPLLARRCGSRGRGKRGTLTRAEVLPDMGVPSPRYQITGEGWRRLSCQPCRGHESPVGSPLGGSGSSQEPVCRHIKDEPNRHSQSRWPGQSPNQAISSQSILSRFFSVHILSFPRRSVDSLFHSFKQQSVTPSLVGCQEKQTPLSRTHPDNLTTIKMKLSLTFLAVFAGVV